VADEKFGLLEQRRRHFGLDRCVHGGLDSLLASIIATLVLPLNRRSM
jgi:hypothetical protein